MPAGILEGGAHLYSVSIQLDSRRARPSNPLFGRLQSRSRQFFSFATKVPPLPGDVPVFLPTVDPTGSPAGGPVYTFNVSDIAAGEVIFIDPDVAIGYDYEVGADDPNFASVLLPEVGDDLFDLYLWDGSQFVHEAIIAAGTEHHFPDGGVDRFRILGIETAAGLDPNDPTAFVTGLTFVSAGQFTGSMTPITVEVLSASLDVKPESCPNPLNVHSRGVVPVAVVGTSDFDVTQVDTASVRLAGVSSLRSALEDVAAPFDPLEGKEAALDCTDEGPDGYPDLTLKFDTQELAAALGAVNDGDVVVLNLTGALLDGTPVQGEDVVVVIRK